MQTRWNAVEDPGGGFSDDGFRLIVVMRKGADVMQPVVLVGYGRPDPVFFSRRFVLLCQSRGLRFRV